MEIPDNEMIILEEMYEMFNKMSTMISRGAISKKLKDFNLTVGAPGDQGGEYCVLVSLEDCIDWGKHAIRKMTCGPSF